MRRQLGPLGWQLLAENELTGLSHTHDALDATAEVDKELFVLSALPKEFPILSPQLLGMRHADQNPAE